MSTEIWKTFYNIEVSNHGHVKTRKNKDGTYIGQDNNGYKQLKTTVEGKYKHYKVHRLVAHLFLGLNLNDIKEINHINHDRSDNRVDNLEIVSKKENLQKLQIHSKGRLYGANVRNDVKKNPWGSQIKDKNNKQIHLGLFKTAEIAHKEAIEAYVMEFKELPACSCKFCQNLMSC